MNYNSSHYFILSSSCRIVKGANRSVVIDYLRKDVNLISNQYHTLIKELSRNKVSDVLEMIESDSHQGFYSFLDFMIQNEFAFLVDDPAKFPEVSHQFHDEHILLKDTIIEIDQPVFKFEVFADAIRQINELYCEDLQIRLLSTPDTKLLSQVFDTIHKTDINFVELHISSQGDLTQADLFNLLDNCTSLTKIYIYNAEKTESLERQTERTGYTPVLIGTAHYIQTPLNEHNCGVITFENLIFNNLDLYQLHTEHNGCLHKKLTIDRYGNLKNCPSMPKTYGNLNDTSIKDLILDEAFKEMGNIKKDNISVCKDCEFRYNCTDCRAFLSDPDDIKSKPLKCGYDPYTNQWEDWSQNPLKNYQ